MADKVAQRKHRKAMVREKIKKEKKALSQKQIDQAMQNMHDMETRRRIAILEFLAAQGFKEPKEQKGGNVPHFQKGRVIYKLQKVNYSKEVQEKLAQDITKYQGLYMIVDVRTETKGIIFQVTFTQKDGFSIVPLNEKLGEKK